MLYFKAHLTGCVGVTFTSNMPQRLFPRGFRKPPCATHTQLPWATYMHIGFRACATMGNESPNEDCCKKLHRVAPARSNGGNHIGFAQNPRRLNVAISRAQKSLTIVGNADVFQQLDIRSEAMAPRQSRPNWMQVVDHFRQFGSLSDGSKVMDRSLRHFVQSQASETAAARDPSKRTRVVVYIGNMKVCHVSFISFMCSSICGLAKVAARIKERARATEARAKAIG